MKFMLKSLLMSSLLTVTNFSVLAQTAPAPSYSNPSMPGNNPVQPAAPVVPSANNLLGTAPTHSTTTTTTTTTLLNPASTAQCSSEGFNFFNRQLMLNSDNANYLQRIFVIQNVSGYTVMITRVAVRNPGAAGWGTKLDAGKAAALAMNQRNFALGCIGYNPPQFSAVDCQSVLRVCAYPPQQNNLGSFWLAENIDPSSVGKVLQERNALPKK